MAAIPFTTRPPKPIPPSVHRFDAQGKPANAQVLFDDAMFQFLVRLVDGLMIMQAKTDASALPTADPHVVGQVWSNAGILTVSAG